MIEVRDLTVRFPSRDCDTALTGVDLRVHPGERVLLLGPSGSGKSTLLRTLAGVVPQSVDAEVRGRVEVAGLPVVGQRVTSVARLALRVATLVQNPMDQLCLPTVAEEVAFALENRAIPVEQIAPKVERALRRVGAGHLADRRTAELSGGEAQRVALAASLVAEPRVLLLDEPTALLDPVSVREIAGVLSHTGGPDRSSVLVEHRLDELGELPGRVVVLGEEGRVVADGPTTDVIADRTTELAAAGVWLPGDAELRAAGLGDARWPVIGPTREPRTDAPVVLRARGLGVRRGDRTVLSGVDLDLREGEVTVVLGINGSGKSSLLLALAGLVPSTGALDDGPGTTRPDGPRRRSRRGRRSRTVGMAFQHPEHQFLGRTVGDDLAWWPRRAGLDSTETARRVAAVVGDYRLDGLGTRDPFRLSGGQQRRLSLASTAVGDHEVLLLDEPTFGQDRRTAAAVARAVARLAARGRALVLVTHDLRLAAAVGDQALVLGHGRVVLRGPARRVLTDETALARAGLVLPGLLRECRGRGMDGGAVVRLLDEAAMGDTRGNA